MPTINGQGQTKVTTDIPAGTIVAYYGPRIPTGWALCDGTNGTPDLTDRVPIGDTAVSAAGTAGGTESAVTGLTHAGFALAAHSAHAVTQPSAHSAHAVTQPAAHSAHAATQPGAHADHASQGAHTHDSHTLTSTGSTSLAGSHLSGPATHASQGAHTHDSHPAHTGFAVDAHSAHAGFAVDAHSAHAGFAVDAHSAHSITQADNHLFTLHKLAYIQRI